MIGKRLSCRNFFRSEIVQLFRFCDESNRIEPETINTFVGPELQDCIKFSTNFRIFPVQIRLLCFKRMQIILACLLIQCPGRTSKLRLPVCGRRTIFPIVPVIEVAVAIISGRSAFYKPEMLVARMIENHIENNTNAKLLCPRQKSIEIFHRPKVRHDLAIVPHVIPVVDIGRVEARSYPDRVNAQFRKVFQPVFHPDEIPDAVRISILEGAGINLVEYAVFPPWRAGLSRG